MKADGRGFNSRQLHHLFRKSLILKDLLIGETLTLMG